MNKYGVTKIALIAGDLSIICIATILIVIAVWACRTPQPNIRGCEQNVIYTLQKVLLGKPLYGHPEEPPFDITQYGPLYYYGVYPLAAALHITAEQPARILSLARSVSAAAGVATWLMAVWLCVSVFRIGRRSAITAATLGLLASTPWWYLARPDALQIALTFGAICLATSYFEASVKNAWQLAVLSAACLCGLLAVFAKQSAADFLVILGVFLLVRKDWRGLAVFGAVACTGFALASMWLVLTWGQAVEENLIGGLQNGFEIRQAFEVYESISPWWMAVAVALSIAMYWAHSAQFWKRWFAFLLGGLFLTSALATLKVGSASVYYAVFLWVASIGIISWLTTATEARTENDVCHRRVVTLTGGVLVMAMVPLACSRAKQYMWHMRAPKAHLNAPADIALADFLRKRLESQPAGYFLDLANKHITLLLPEHALLPQFEVAECAWQQGVFEYSHFTALVESGHLRYVVMNGPLRPMSFLGADLAKYRHIQDIGRYSVYEHPSAGLSSDNSIIHGPWHD